MFQVQHMHMTDTAAAVTHLSNLLLTLYIGSFLRLITGLYIIAFRLSSFCYFFMYAFIDGDIW